MYKLAKRILQITKHRDQFKMDIEQEILLAEINLVTNERLRRSKQQFEYIRLNILNVGIISIFGILKIVDVDAGIASALLDNHKILISMMVVLSVISTTLFLFWVDDALTIAAIDRFLQQKEESVDKSGNLYWYEYREGINSTSIFQMKKWIFNIAVFMSFIFSTTTCFVVRLFIRPD